MKQLFRIFLVLVLCLLPVNMVGNSPAYGAIAPNILDQDLISRLENIKAAMAKIRFCYNENCFYRNITSRITPPTKPGGYYMATVSATIDRPSTVLDTADYTLGFINQRWQLLKGEEYTDVAEYSFIGDRYEIFSVHANRSRKGNLEQARKDSNLKSGYLTMYYDIFDRGIERLKKP